MQPEEYEKILLAKGFVFLREQEAWTQHRGIEYIYTHPEYKYKFYIKRISDIDGSPWGFNAQQVNGKLFEKIVPSNTRDNFRNKNTPMWTDDTFISLMNKLT